MMLWIPVTLAASAFQVARNAAQRRLMDGAGPWGATLVRFLFGLPFSVLFVLGAWAAAGEVAPRWSGAFFAYAATGATAQVAATAALLVSLRRSGFAVGTAMQQSGIPLTGLIGWMLFGDRLSGMGWAGIALATAGLLALTLVDRRADAAEKPVSGALFGLAASLLFAFCMNAYRHAAAALEPGEPLFSAVTTVALTQALQSAALGAWLAWRHPAALEAVLRGWRGSLAAGLCGALASCGWVFALALAPAAAVRAVGVAEAPIAAAAGRRLFAERLPPSKLLAGAVVAAGVVLVALG